VYAIETKDYGFKLTFGGFISKDEMEKWRLESATALKQQRGDFGVFVDMQTLKPLPEDTQKVMVDGQQLYKRAGMKRSAVILNNPITTMQFRRLAKDSGIYQWERYLDSSSCPNWEKAGVKWLVEGVDPDL
jgi:hypothetical protein